MSTTGLQHAFLLDGKGGARKLDWAGVRGWSPNDGVIWINLDYSQPDAAAWLDGEARLDPLIRDALLDTDPRPRATAFGEDLMLIVRGVNMNEGSDPEDMISVRAWIEPRRIITMRHRVSRSLKILTAEVEQGRGPTNAGGLAIELVEKVVEHLVTRVDKLGDEIAACEDQALGDPRGDLRGRLADLRRRAIALRRFLAPQREALQKLGQISLPWLDDNHHQRVVEKVVEHLVTRVDKLGDEIAACEDQVLGDPRGDLRGRLADLRRRAIALRSDALQKLGQISLPWLDDNHHQRVVEVADRMTRTVEELDAARDRAAVTQEELSSRQSETTNQRLYVLSIITAVFLPLGFVCSLLGVNVGGVPFTHDDWAFWALIAVFAIGVWIQVQIFKRRGWIRKDR